MRRSKRFIARAGMGLALLFGAALLLNNCGKGEGTRDFLPNFDDRGSIMAPGRGAVEFLNSCFNLPPGEIAEFVGWMSAQVKLDNLAKVCRGLAAAGYSEGVSTTREPADI